MIELHDTLRDIERMVIGQRDHAGAELDVVGALTDGGQEQLGRSDYFPAGGMVLTAPEFVITELVELLGEIDIALELQGRIFADRMMRREKCAETCTCHGGLPLSSASMLTLKQTQRNYRLGRGWSAPRGGADSWLARLRPRRRVSARGSATAV
jgi:hypothetical protein